MEMSYEISSLQKAETTEYIHSQKYPASYSGINSLTKI